MTEQQFLEEIKQLSIAERIALIEAIFHSLRDELETRGRGESIFGKEQPGTNSRKERQRISNAMRRALEQLKNSDTSDGLEEFERDWGVDDQGSSESNSLISQRLYGILKFDGEPPTDEEVKDAYADYLLEKYS